MRISGKLDANCNMYNKSLNELNHICSFADFLKKITISVALKK